MTKPFLNQYEEFVDGVTSDASKNHEAYIARLNELYAAGCDIARLDTAATGLNSEAGEFIEIVKKMKFQGKPYIEENIFHLKRELGDVMWYFATACMALRIDPYEVVEENVRKLQNRYPGGFAIVRSEVRAEDDI
jgi:NTP pyrophosphatase (non-canonical NTP hydrolase)